MRNLSLIINFLLILIVLPFSYLRAEVDSLNIKYRVVGSIPFSPVEGDAIDVSLLNNEVSGELPIGFPFRFFENTYTGFYISSNGFITFSADNYHGCCSGQLLPEPSSPNNLIAFDWEYLLPENGGTINYFTTGSAPNRKLVVNFNNVPTYSSGNPVTTQIVLFEGTNIIEVHTTQLTNDGWERTMGLENSDGTIAYTVPERNSTNWTASEEGVRFEPYFQKDDAGLQAINSPQPYICTNGSFPIEVTVQNFGTNILESVNVNWELNGVLQQPLLVQTPLYPRITGDSSVLKVTLGSLAFSLGQEFSVKAWTSLPNGVMDSVNNNDTLSVLAKGALGGNFTIGGSNPDFATFADAVTSLITYGICQPVVFNIRSGIYNEQVSIPEIPGATGINTITFQSETGNAADVQLIYSADYDDNYILQLNNAGNIIVKNITLEATNETYGRVIDIRNSPYTNSFIGNRIIGIGLATSDYQASVIYLSDDNSGGGEFKGKGLRGLNNTSLYALDAEHNTSFLNNYIKGGSYGVYLYAYGSEEDYNIKGVVFENNQFDEQYYTGLYLSGRINVKVIGNSIKSTNSSSWLYGINCSYLQSPFEIGRNKISLVNGTGIYFYGSYSPEQSNGIVANNFISLGGDNNNYGINLSYSSRISFYHNNIHIYSSASNAIPFYTYGCEQLKLYNNIFANSGQGYAIQVNSGDISESDYNSFYTKGTSLGYWSGNILKGITEWRNTTSLDMHSYFTDPLYVSSTDLHVNKALLNGTGLSLPEIIIDIDGQSRQNPPDIGADEFVPVNENVELIDLDYPHLPFAPGSYPIKAVIKNSGASVLVSLDISWQINGDAKPDLHWTGSLPTGQSDTVELGTFTFVYKSSYSIKAWTSKPNNSDDIEPINDTIATDTFYPALSGAYTIGGNSPDFTTFAEVSDILNKGGVSGFATFNIRNGTYTEQFTLGRFPGSSCTNTVTFQPESGDSTAVIIQHNSEYNNNYILKLNGAIGVVIRKLTFRPQNQYYGHAIEMTNGSSCNLISNNIFNGIATTSSSDIGAIIYSPYGDNELHNDNKNIFINNKFRFGSSGITFIGYGSTRETGTLIKRNLFENQAYNGIFLQYQNAPRIEENIISTSTNNTSFFGIYASSCYDSSVIEKNKIAITHGGYGVYVESNTGRSGAEALIANNFISIGGNSTAYGIYTYYGSYQKIYHNNINITSLNVSGSAFYSYNCGNLQILNNILTNSAAGFAINFYNLYNSVSDYNNLYSKGIYLGYTSVNISDIASWRTALNQDHNSISTNPLFYSATDLHVNKALLNGRGVAVSEVTTDIDGEPRDQVPDIGADEFTPSGSNVQFVSLSTPTAPFAPGTYPVSARIKNAGSDTLTSVSVLWQVNGVSQPTYSWTGALVTGAEDSVLLGNIPFTLGSGSNIKAWVAEPNGGTDIDPDDDTIRINNIYASLSGTYTIGGTSPDFTTFDAAIKALNYGGVRAPVTFNIRNGTYTEQLSLQNFPGTKCDIPVTFQAESGDSTAVILQYNANASNNYTLQLNGTQGVTIKKLTIKSLNASYGRVISILNGAQCNKFLGNVLQGTNTGSTSDYNAIVYSPTGNSALQNDSKNIFSNNWFRNGSFGIFFNGYSSPLETGTVIEDNFFENQFYMGVWLQYQQATAINRNRIITNSTYSSFFGIYANSCYNTSSFQNNKINIANGGYGIYLYSTYGTSGSEALIANNFISIGGTSTAIGISTYYGSYLKAYHNSVNITSSNSSGRAYYSYNSSYVQLYNNIFANSGSGYGIYIDYNNYGNAYNYNNIYSKGPYLAYLNGNLADIAAWRAASNQDNNSVSTNPLFLSFSDLHVNKAVLNGRGISVAEVTTDIDGETRSNPPDIGADEFTAEGSNVHLIALNLPKAPFAPGLYPVSAIIKNVGADTLTSVDISWEVNGVQQPAYNWTGSLLTEGEDSVLLGSFAFNNVSASNVKAWVSNPNGSTDVDPSDDTLRVGNLYASLSGTFTIGGSPADFPTFNAAVNALNYGGITGPVTFNIRNGIYSEQVTLRRFPGSSCEVPVTFQSENGDNTVTLQYNAASNANYTILFDGASGITIKEIIIKSLNTSYGRVVEFAAGASCNKIIGSVLQGASSTSSSTSHAVVLSSSGNNLNENCNNNVFSNNRILSGSYGFYYLGYSSSIGYLETGTVIHGNVFQGQYYKGIFLQSQLAPQITENTLSTTSTRTDFFGVHFVYCYDNFGILKNKISSNGGYGIYLEYVQGRTGAEGLIANNFVSVGGNSTAYGITSGYTTYLKIYHNNVRITSTNLSGGRAFYRSSQGGNDLEILNNIFANTGGGYSFYTDYTFGIKSSNHNNLFTTGTNLGYWNGNRTSLAAWKATTGFDGNSISADPDFVSATDLHTKAVNMDGKAIPVAQVTDDIDGQLRHATTPDIGADEYTTAVHDAAIRSIASPSPVFPSGANEVKVVLLNNAIQPLTRATINWSVNDSIQLPYEWTGTLAPGNNIQVLLGSFNFVIDSVYSIKAWSSNPNNENDEEPANDSAKVENIYAGLGGTYTIGGDNPDFLTFTKAVNALVKGGVVSPVNFKVRNGTYIEQISVPEIRGVSATNSVVFQSESDNRQDVKITHAANTEQNYTVQLNGADFISFRGMIIEATNTSFGVALDIRNGSSNNSFVNNIFRGINTPAGYAERSVIYSPSTSSLDNNNSFERNEIIGGSYGILYYGYSTGVAQREAGTKIENNTFTNQSYIAIHILYQESPIISSNKINTNAGSNFYGILAQSCYNKSRIERNNINTNGGYGIYLYDCDGASGNKGLVANNFVTLKGTSTAYGIYLYYADFQDFYFNTVNITSTYANGGRAFYLAGATACVVKNNIFANTGGGYSIVVDNPTGLVESDYNDLYTTGSVLGYSSGDLANLTAWKNSTGKDVHSLSINPLFISPEDLHVRETALKNAGVNIPGIVNDIDLDTRDNTPDIGADEFIPPANDDAGIVAINRPKAPFGIGSQSVMVTVRNYGALPLTQVKIKWQINGAMQPDYNWTGALASGRQDSVALGVRNFSLARKYDIKAWTESPNGKVDSLSYNDTSKVDNLYAALAGTYTIGGADPDFVSLTEAVEALKNGGVAGQVILGIRPGVYDERISIPQIVGTSQDKRIIFRPETGDSTSVLLTKEGTWQENYIVQLSGADFITFEKLSFAASSANYARIMDIRNGADYNVFKNNLFRGRITTQTWDGLSVIYSPANSLNQYNQFTDNRILNGSIGIYFHGYNGSNKSKGILIRNNILDGQQYSGINVAYLDAPVIKSNTITTASTRDDFYALSLYDCDNDIQIEKNKIVSANGGYGLFLQYSSGQLGTTGRIVNNTISLGGTENAFGIRLIQSSHIDILHNSVNITGTHSTNGRAFSNYYSDNLQLVNNIFANTGGGYAIHHDNIPSFSNSDYNDLYTTGSVLGFWGDNRTNLSAWRNASGNDLHSFSVDPYFYSESDLHTSQIILDSVGTSVGVIDDMDGDLRNLNRPDIGADEFKIFSNDIGISALISPSTGCGLDSLSSVKARVINFGGNAQSGFNLAYSFNGNVVVENVGSTILPGKNLEYTFNTKINIPQTGDYNIKVYTLLNTDLRKENDTLKAVFHNYPVLQAANWNLLPQDNAVNLSKPVVFSWSSIQNAKRYDLYIWADSLEAPATPTITDIQQISYTYNTGLNYGAKYKWKIVAKNECSITESPVQSFRLRSLPELIVNNIETPNAVYSGQQIQLTWEVRNTGTGGTGAIPWIDAVYLSTDATLEYELDTYLGGVANFSALAPNQSYKQNASFTIPQGYTGNYYVIVHTNRYNGLLEVNLNNNINVAPTAMAVSLTPPPDLRVISIIAPEIAFSSQEINLTWTVKNAGNGAIAPTTWYDKIYLTTEEQFTGNGYNMGRFRHTGGLLTDSSYTQTETLKLPDGIFGKYYLYVQTDQSNQVYEHVFEVNNITRSDSMRVILTPPADYAVTQVTIPSSASNRQTITVQWTVENQGGTAPDATNWTDGVYLSRSATFNADSVIAVGSIGKSGTLNPTDTYNAQREIIVPASIQGAYYVFVKTDINKNIFEYTNEENNILRSTNPLVIRQPDLIVSEVSTGAPANSGQPIQINWTITNSGSGVLYSTKWVDRIYISNLPQFNVSTAVKLDSLEYTAALNPGDSLLKQKQVSLPNGISGNHYIFVYTDFTNKVFEGAGEANNTGRSAVFPVNLSPWADLQVVSVESADTLQAGANAAVKFTVINKGLASTALSSWKDRIYISPDSIFNANAILLGDWSTNNLLKADSSYTSVATLLIPPQQRKGVYYIHVFADGNNLIYEHTGENNNSRIGKAIYIKSYPPLDLKVNAAIVSGNANSGKPLKVSWTVNNIGLAPTFASKWLDGIYLSKDAIWSESDKLIGEFQKDGPLKAGNAYSNSQNVIIPNGFSGSYFVLVVADHSRLNNDIDYANNVLAAVDTAQGPGPITITLTPPSDLVVASFNAPNEGTSGQPVAISWTIRNQGVGTTAKGSWTDRIYLSTDNEIDNNDRVIGTVVRTGNLAGGASYSQTLDVTMPISESGNFILLIKTDNNDAEYEHEAENNNVRASLIKLTRPPLSDLIVSDIEIPEEAEAAAPVNLSWTIKNIGLNPSSGQMKEALYFSADSVWDVNDVVVGTYDINFNLAPLGEKTRNVTTDIPGVSLGKYYLFVKTDILNNIYESNDSNNVAHSEELIDINVRTLPIDVLTSATLQNQKPVYYKIEVPANLVGESLIVLLEGDSINGSNEVYLRHGAMPTRAEYDYAQDNPFQGDQEIIVPTLEPGIYYMLIYGSTSVGTTQQIELLARKLNFEIRAVNASRGGNTGKVTLQINGSKFIESMKVMLKRGTQVIPADTVWFINQTKVFAKFDLSGEALGLYDILAENDQQDTARLFEGFRVVAGTPAQLLTNVLAPSSTRPGTLVAITIQFTNAGNTDIENPVVELTSAGGAPVGFTVEGLDQNIKKLRIPLKELNGPEGVLRPGVIGSVTVYGKATSNLSFVLLLPDLKNPN